MFKWLSAKNSEAFGLELAKLVKEFIPNEPKLTESKRKSKENYAKQKMLKRIREFKQDEILNFYKIAKMLNAFKWDLKDAGFDQELSGRFASWILINIREEQR